MNGILNFYKQPFWEKVGFAILLSKVYIYMNLDNLKDIINTKEIQPSVINESSNFVVVTYWWGRSVNNQNTSSNSDICIPR